MREGQTAVTDARTRNRQGVASAIAFAAADAKVRYDDRHKSITMEPSNMVVAELYEGYHVPGWKMLSYQS